MLILLPPSESKAAVGRRRRPVDLGALSHPELTEARRTVLDALVEVSARPDALALLGVGASLGAEVAGNRRLLTAPATDLAKVYSGVLYAALDLPGLGPAARRRACSSVVVVSALWGAVSPGDRIPAYRLAMGTDLPGVGSLAAHWRAHLGPVLDAEADTVVVDCRSAAYVAAWRPTGDAAARTVAVRVLSGDAVVSHDAKHTRGLLTRHLLERGDRPPRTPRRLAQAAGERFDVDLVRHGAGWRLDVQSGPRPQPASTG